MFDGEMEERGGEGRWAKDEMTNKNKETAHPH